MRHRDATRPRVLFAVGALSPVGGSESQLVEIATQLHGVAVDATVVTAAAADAGVLDARLAAAGIPVVTVGSIEAHRLVRPAIVAARYGRIVGAVRPDVIYPWLEETSVFLVPLARGRGARSVVARRNISGAQVERLAVARFAIRTAEAMADIVTANSQAVLEQALRRGIPGAKLRLVRNAHADVPPLPVPAGVPTIGYVANFREEKGHRRFVDALSRLPRDTPWQARFAGDGVTLASVRERTAELGLETRVHFDGRIEDPRAFWGRCHVAALLSDHEGSPNALIEAGFAGRPIVATDVGGVAEIVPPGAGWLVGLDAAPATAAILERLLGDPALRAEAGRRAHAHVSRQFSMQTSVAGHLNAIEEALGG